MKRVLAWLAGLAGIAALLRRLARRRRAGQRAAARAATTVEPATAAAAEPVSSSVDGPAGDPAEELRRRLAETREAEAGDGPPAPPAEEETLEERRARVHAKAREAIDAMADDGASR